MSLPSYKLSKAPGGPWLAKGALPSGRPFTIDAGKGSQETARAIVEIKLRGKLASSKGSRDRWAKWKREKAAGVGARAEVRSGPADDPAPTSAPASTPAARAAPRRDDAELRAKLLGLGDQGGGGASSSTTSAVEADEVIPPGAERGDDGEPLDEEGSELISGLLAKGAVLGLVALTNAQLKKRKPPQKGEPHEKGLEWFHDGLEVQLAKLLGRTSTLGPTGKIFAGAAIIVASIYMTAENIDGAEAAAAPPAPEAAPTETSSTTNGANGEHVEVEERSLTRMDLGTFGKVGN